MILALFAILVLASVTIFRCCTGQIPFESAAWRSGDAKLRFRMKDSLEAKYRAGELRTREEVDRVLGPDDDREKGAGNRNFGLMQWYGNPWYLRVWFDKEGRVIDLSAHAS